MGQTRSLFALNNMKNLLCILLVFISFGVRAQQTYSISGTVSDEKGITLPGATVYITNSKYIQATDNEGKFSFGNLRPGTYEVVVKMMGSIPNIQRVIIDAESVNLTDTLKESVTSLKAVTINGNGPNPNREKYLEQFMKNFLGETVNAQQCKLLNPDALSFHFSKADNTLTADADDFLVVENNALGYKIEYLLTKFDFEPDHGVVYINGSPYFEELKGTDAQQKKWNENRRIAYLSSQRHFFSAVMNNTVKEENFLVYKVIDEPSYLSLNSRDKQEVFGFYEPTGDKRTKLYFSNIPDIDSLFAPDRENFRTIISTDKLGLFIVYTGQDESPLFSRTGNPISLPAKLASQLSKHRQVSKLVPLRDAITIDRNFGWPQKGFNVYGYWSWLRIADLTPLDYFGVPASANK